MLRGISAAFCLIFNHSEHFITINAAVFIFRNNQESFSTLMINKFIVVKSFMSWNSLYLMHEVVALNVHASDCALSTDREREEKGANLAK